MQNVHAQVEPASTAIWDGIECTWPCPYARQANLTFTTPQSTYVEDHASVKKPIVSGILLAVCALGGIAFYVLLAMYLVEGLYSYLSHSTYGVSAYTNWY